MRRVETEGDSQSNSRRRSRSVARSPLAQKPRLRRLALEGLEDRTLMSTLPKTLSTLPSPVATGRTVVGGGLYTGLTNTPNSSSPSVAVDPLDPSKLIAAWTTYDPANKLDGPNGQVTAYIQGAYSVDGGATWAELPNDTVVDVQTDFSVATVTNGPQPNFAQTTDATVAFGRDESAYLLSSTHSGTGGVLNLQKWDFSNANATTAPASATFARPAYDTLSGTFYGISDTINPIYRWQGSGANDAALTPTLAVDNNVPVFSDGSTSQSDPHAGNVYVAWETNDAPLKGQTTYNPNLIKMMASGDGGQDFTYQAYLSSGHGQGNTFDQPRIAISQGSSTVPGGQVTIVYDNAGPGSNAAPYFDEVLTQSSATGGTDAHADSPTNVGINLGANAIPIPVNITDPNFNSLQNLTVTLSLAYPNLGDTGATLTSPGGTTVTLWNNATNTAGNATNLPGTLTGANVGAATLNPNTAFFPVYIGTTLDSTAYRSLSGDGAAPYTGHFRPFNNLQAAFRGMTAAQINGTWTLTITQFRPETITAPAPNPTLYGASLDFTSGLSDVTDGPQSFVATSFLNSGTKTFTEGIQGIPVLPNPSIASDNTLGSHSPHQGRLYIALVDDNFNAVSLAYTTSTFIELYTSDDGGSNWSYAGIVNDDNGLTDGFSAGGYAQPVSVINASNPPLASNSDPGVVFFGDSRANVRPKIEPQVAVDPYTGTLVVSFLDTRNDASSVRVANYIAASTDGGSTFAPETYANPTTNVYNSPVIDAITGNPVNLGPIPDNESSGNNNREATFGFGQRQGLAVADGHIFPVWSSNQNTGSQILNNKSFLDIESAVMTFAAGPRVIASTQGPVGEPGDAVNTARAADGTPIANTIVFTFDRAVDPNTFPADGTTNPIGTSPLQVFYNNPSGTAAGVPLRVLAVTHDSTDTVYTVTFDPAGHGVGTYSYTLRPLVRGLIPYQTSAAAGGTSQVPFVDTAVNGGQASFTVSGHGNIQLTTATLLAKADIYQKGTSTGSPNDLQIFLVAQDNTQYLLYSGTTQGQAADVGFDVSNTISIPAIPLQLLDQTYKIKVVDNVPGEKVFVYNNVNTGDFNFQVQLSNQGQAGVSGNLMDQNANGVPGESPGDDYSIPNSRNSLPLIVAGPHVTTTSVNGAGGTPVSSGPDNLVTNYDPNSLNVTFDRTMRVGSFTPAQVLSIVGPVGRIDGPQTFTSTGTARTFAYNGNYQLIPKSGALTSTILIANTGLNVSNLTVNLNVTDPNDASLAISLVAPDGTTVPLVLNNTAAGANFTNTVFSDSPAANGLNLTVPGAPAGAGAPYSLTYKPSSPLSALAGKALDGTWKLVIADSTGTGAQGRLNAWSLNVTPQVPEGAGTSLNSSLVVSSYPDNSFKIAHLAVQLNIASNRNSDLQVSLVSPVQGNGSQITVPLVLAGTTGGSNFANTIFDDNGTIPIASGAAPYSLTYKPAGSLAALNGLSIEGTWTLQVVDPNANGSVTTLNSWSLIATPQLTVTPVNPVNGGATTFTIGFPTQKLSGTYTVTLSPNILSVAANPANPSMGTPLDSNLNAGVDALRGTSGGVTTTVSYPATSVPVSIPYAQKLPIGPVVPGVLTSQINVPDNFAIQGDTLNLAGLTVSLNLTYYYDPDLTVTLTAPDGKTVTLFMNVGKGTVTADFHNTTLSDVTTPPSPITAANAPFFGTFNPQSPLSAFATDASGNQAFSQGLWTLTINNQGLDPGPGVDSMHPPALLGWSLSFQRPQTNTGLGEPVADQKTVSFRLFNIAPSDPLANDTWTAVGPAGTSSAGNPLVGPINPITGVPAGNPGGVNLGGPVSVVALDPSDPSGNTAYVGASSGGVWKTTNFLTTAANGPTYVPLTDFGTNYSINIGAIAIFPRNSDPSQSIVFAGTGDGQATTSTAGNSVQGVGILRSTNGGASFTLLDSSVNVDASGNPLPINSPLRDHIFVGSTTYKMVVDPKPLPNGGVIVYAALGGKNAGLYRSLDGGNDWQLLRAGTATDVLLDPVSVSPSTGNLDIVYAAFQGQGVYISTNRGLSFSLLAGTVGATNLIQNSLLAPAVPLTVNDANTPNGAFGRIVLSKPAPTNNAAQNTLYQDRLYAAVENTDGTFRGLYITKDRGENWTKAQIASQPSPGLTVTEALPTNDNTQANNYDVTNGVLARTHNGNSAFSMAVDPLNPNIVYLGGTQDYQTSGLIRVDLTGIYDAHAWVPFANDRNDGGKLTLDSTGRAVTNNLRLGIPFYEGTNPSDIAQQTGEYYVNLRHNPNNPFDTSSTLFVANSNSFLNDGTGVRWTPLDTAYLLPMQGSTNVHQMLPLLDPLTGLTRLIFADDQGVFTGLFNGDGTLDTGGIGTAATVNGSLNGNLQDEQIYRSAAQPSTLAAQAAGALFYGSGIGMTDARSAPDLLSSGNLTWTVQGPAYGDLQNIIGTNDRGGTGIATDQTGGVSPSSPNGNPSAYEFDVPFLGGDSTNFFRVNTNGQTTGLVNNYQVEFPANNVTYNGVVPLGYFAVNPINGSQILISSTLGNVYQTTSKGTQWLQIGSGQAANGNPADFDGTYAPALAYGAPDPTAPNGVGNLNNFIYVGTVGGHIYVTQNGAGPWTALSAGLDGSSIVSIFTNPNRSSHEAYAVTLKGVYYMANSIASSGNPNPTWVNITGNLAQVQHGAFNDPTFSENSLLNYGNGQLGGFRSIVADYRYAVPDPVTPTTTYPVLYVAGYGGVFRSLDNGSTWTAFPNTSFDAAPADGGYLPHVDVTGLQLNLGAINPATGHATQSPGDPEVLLASTLGRGDFAIRLAPTVFPSTVGLDPTLPAPNGSATGAVNGNTRLTNLVHPYIAGTSEISNFGNLVTITLIDEATGQVIGTGTTDTFGHFSVMVGSLANDPTFAVDGVKNVGIQATDSSGAKGNVTIFTYTLKATPPPAPTNLTLVTDTGRFANDDVTNFIPPVFSVNTSEPATTQVQLYRFNPALPVGQQYELVDTQKAGTPTVRLTDRLLATDFPMPPTIDTQFTYYAVQIDQATNPSTPLNSIGSDPTKLTIRVDTTPPPAPNAPTLDPSTNSGLDKSANITNSRNPLFDFSGLQAGNDLLLYRSIGGSTPIFVGAAPVGSTQVRDTAGVAADGVYLYQAAQSDLAGNISPLSMGVVVTINTQTPAMPTLTLLPADDSGAPSHPGVTRSRTPRFVGNGTPGLQVVVLSVTGTNYAQGVPITPATIVSAGGTYQANTNTPLADGVYTLVARTVNAAGNFSYSAPLTLTVKAIGPQILPTLSIFPADNTGLKTDSVTANRRPRFVGATDKGVTVTLYSLVNGQLSAPLASTTASAIDGSFQLQLPFQLSNGSTQLVAQASDVAGNKGLVSPALNLQIVTVAGDYANSGAAQFSIYQPTSETYYVLGVGTFTSDTTPGRDVPIQYDINGDGKIDGAGYQFDTATYVGPLSSGGSVNFQFGNGRLSLPVSGYFDSTGTFEYGLYNPDGGKWVLYLPKPGGQTVTFGTPKVDIPVPAAYDGNGITEVATFRPSVVKGNDADSFNVVAPNFINNYQVSFTDPTVPALKGFTYKAGDIPAPADYDGIGKDEFAIYRPTTGQFFILKVPNLFDKTTWTLRTVSMNLPGGPKVGDQPVSEDYEGTGKASPAVYRPSNSTFYEIQTTNGIQRAVPFGQAGVSVAAAGPLLYRLSALFGPFATSDGYGGGPGAVASALPAAPGVHADAVAVGTTATTGNGSPQVLPGSSTIALAMPTAVVTPAPTAPVPTAPAPTSSASIPLTFTRVTAPVATPATSNHRVTVGAPTPKAAAKTHVAAKPVAHPAVVKKSSQPAKAAPKAATPAKAIKLAATSPAAKAAAHPVLVHAAASVNLGPIRKGRKND